ncbi:hypothetical protein J6590_018423 [Homalodisca vitripennis]|nr:hypothetical protein J6590_018423 [Homalodisca vitripennis]
MEASRSDDDEKETVVTTGLNQFRPSIWMFILAMEIGKCETDRYGNEKAIQTREDKIKVVNKHEKETVVTTGLNQFRPSIWMFILAMEIGKCETDRYGNEKAIQTREDKPQPSINPVTLTDEKETVVTTGLNQFRPSIWMFILAMEIGKCETDRYGNKETTIQSREDKITEYSLKNQLIEWDNSRLLCQMRRRLCGHDWPQSVQTFHPVVYFSYGNWEMGD